MTVTHTPFPATEEMTLEFGSFTLPYSEGKQLQETIQSNENLSYSWLYGREENMMVFDNLTITIRTETLINAGILPAALAQLSFS